MHTTSELIRLAAHKAALRRKIGLHRAQCVESCRHLAQPLAWMDRALILWRKLSPVARYAALPLGFLLQRVASPRMKFVSSLLKWGPVVFTTVRRLTAKPSATAPSFRPAPR